MDSQAALIDSVVTIFLFGAIALHAASHAQLLAFGPQQIADPRQIVIARPINFGNATQVSQMASVNNGAGACWRKPPGCYLECAHGYEPGLRECLCVCRADPCTGKSCRAGEICVGRGGTHNCVALVPRQSTRYTTTVGSVAYGFAQPQISNGSVGGCPRVITAGQCITKCRNDADCPYYTAKCCYNGCGSECMAPVDASLGSPQPIRTSRPVVQQPLLVAAARPSPSSYLAPGIDAIRPQTSPKGGYSQSRIAGKLIPTTNGKGKPGQCPPNYAKKGKPASKTAGCHKECTNGDGDCHGVNKCCAYENFDEQCTSMVCAPPEKAGGCIHLLSAVDRLPTRQLHNAYVPSCSPEGDFNPVQCDFTHCWCVEVASGNEILGTKVPKHHRMLVNCKAPRECPESRCQHSASQCSRFGFVTDEAGCPTPDCQCRNMCTGVKCNNKFDECQLVEPNCATPPCAPVPRCLLNPCPSGLPMTLPNGVTAMCKQPEQCQIGFWCHQIGYNGVGFCCSAPEQSSRPVGECKAVPTQGYSSLWHIDMCGEECKADSDCPASEQKCCFDGCGLKCTNTLTHRKVIAGRVEESSLQHNRKALLARPELTAECPAVTTAAEEQAGCESNCNTHSDCQGMSICCAIGCARECVYPWKTTRCLHQAITHAISNQPESEVLQCGYNGKNFERIQCFADHCFCVDPYTGHEVAGTRVDRWAGQTPNCTEGPMHASKCPPQQCQESCAPGADYVLDDEGCSTCRCSNPCSKLQCKSGEICLMAPVECLEGAARCPPQPRCIPNVCKDGRPYAPSSLVHQCDGLCPVGYWCNMVGLPGKGGVCCPVDQQSKHSLRSALSVIIQQHRGTCPQRSVITHHHSNHSAHTAGAKVCTAQCRNDTECSTDHKCCFNGCGMECTSMPHPFTPQTTSTSVVDSPWVERKREKMGECYQHKVSPRQQDCRGGLSECEDDSDCSGVTKCCSDGCHKRCKLPYRTTPCLHLKGAIQQIDLLHDGAYNSSGRPEVRCTEDGHFEAVQCDQAACWCVNTWSGEEVQGTRVPNNMVGRVTTAPTLDCRFPRLCPPSAFCSEGEGDNCALGRVKDSDGCDTCECLNPCAKINCGGGDTEESVCVAQKVKCLDSNGRATINCPPIPKCMANVCQLRDGLLLYSGSYEPVECRQNTDCPLYYYCRMVAAAGGYCCFGKDDQPTAGKNNLASHPQIQNRVDASHSTVSSASSTPHPPHASAGKIGECPLVERIGSSAICNGGAVGAERSRDSCANDESCPGNQRCCFDGCIYSCLHPKTATECLHEAAAAQVIARLAPNTIFEPACESDGSYSPIQRQTPLAWCVDHRGREVEGTKRLSLLLTSCNSPSKSLCPARSCSNHCPFGYETNLLGCNDCVCRDPCKGVRCPQNTVCRMVNVECLDADECSPVPKCVVNACLRGAPLEDTTTRQLITCDETGSTGSRCPAGWYCLKFGLEDGGYCCPGLVTQKELRLSALHCPALPAVYGHNRPMQVKCRMSSECADGEPCCFNGKGTSCFPATTRKNGDVSEKKRVSSIPLASMWHSPEKIQPIASAVGYHKSIGGSSLLGSCPSAASQQHSRGDDTSKCVRECEGDAECGRLYANPFSHCCSDGGCGTRCQYPTSLTPCGHLMLAELRESGKHYRSENSKQSPTGVQRPQTQVRCNPDGLFNRVQCRSIARGSGACWCVDPKTGVEVAGTRLAEGSGEPNCEELRPCATQCGNGCEHGVRLDESGCPLSSICECRSPCEDFKCANESDVCTLKTVECPRKPCPAIPECVPNWCGEKELILHGIGERPLRCDTLADCGGDAERVECKFGTGKHEMSAKGLCCFKETADSLPNARGQEDQLTSKLSSFPQTAKVGMCPPSIPIVQQHPASIGAECTDKCANDEECPGMGKCCQAGCMKTCMQPLQPTNCVNLLHAIQELQKERIPHSLHAPTCTARVGMFTPNQCDQNGACWCVDSILAQKTCPILCDDVRIAACFFGTETDSEGCPRTSECKCRMPCQEITCPSGRVCVMRQRECQEEVCLPVPRCEIDPCGSGEPPLSDPATGLTRACRVDAPAPENCQPTAHCTASDEYGLGVCCPGRQSSAAPPSRNGEREHQPKSANNMAVCTKSGGLLLPQLANSLLPSCTPSSSSECPATTHNCIVAPANNNSTSPLGTCCPTKSHVCGLLPDEGECTIPTPRYYYDTESQSCLQFMWRGCSGNLNNFLSLYDCRRFCSGLHDKVLVPMQNDDGDVSKGDGFNLHYFYNVAFSLAGPLDRGKHGEGFQRALKAYLQKEFHLTDEEIIDLEVKDDNSARFTILSPTAATKAERISNAVTNGGFNFTYIGGVYRAEPSTFVSYQASKGEPSGGGSNASLWAVLIASTCLAAAVVFILCCSYNFIRLRAQMDQGSSISYPAPSLPSPLPYNYNSRVSAFLSQQQWGHTGGGEGQFAADGRGLLSNPVLSRDNGRAKKSNAVGPEEGISRRNLVADASVNNRLLVPITYGTTPKSTTSSKASTIPATLAEEGQHRNHRY